VSAQRLEEGREGAVTGTQSQRGLERVPDSTHDLQTIVIVVTHSEEKLENKFPHFTIFPLIPLMELNRSMREPLGTAPVGAVGARACGKGFRGWTFVQMKTHVLCTGDTQCPISYPIVGR
jgi:hypothetical protein